MGSDNKLSCAFVEFHTFLFICRLVYGSALAENRTAFFLCPPEVADAWLSALPPLSAAIKAEDPRMVWLKDHYLFLYFQDDLCMGPLAADAIKVGELDRKDLRNRTSTTCKKKLGSILIMRVFQDFQIVHFWERLLPVRATTKRICSPSLSSERDMLKKISVLGFFIMPVRQQFFFQARKINMLHNTVFS